MREARELLGFACKLYSMQVDGGRVFMHEHPNTATSWGEEPIKELMKNPQVDKYILDMCCYNLQSSDRLGTGVAKKTTGILTNSEIFGKF